MKQYKRLKLGDLLLNINMSQPNGTQDLKPSGYFPGTGNSE